MLLTYVITTLKSKNIETVCSISDQGPTNQGAISILRSQCEEGKHDPVSKVAGLRVIHLWDFPHLLKNIRNNLLTSDLLYKDKLAEWKHVIEFFKLDEGICKISKLTYAHLCPVGRNKMTVKLALQVFSESASTGMKTFHHLSGGKFLSNALPTAEFLGLMDKLTDAVTGPSRHDKPKVHRCDVTQDSFHHSYWREMIVELQKWVFIRKDGGKHHVPPCIHGFIDNLRALGWIWNRMKELGFEVTKLRLFNQDTLELYFGQARQTCGSGTNPTLQQFIAGMKTLLVQCVSAPLRESNCSNSAEDSDTHINNVTVILSEIISELQDDEDPQNPTLMRAYGYGDARVLPSYTKLMRQGPSLNCATICSKILSCVELCPTCTENLTTENNSSDFLLQGMRENSTIEKPCPNLTNLFLKTEKEIVKDWDSFAWKPNVRAEVIKKMEEVDSFGWLNCEEHV
ncbi:hypothetical protein ONE63_001663 [Megalurothrips usitatus]|uniref:Transposable element P transposase n=1 Tax=Megalurothrips usitatus TaxID=439358 RepID=A0AAV7XG95_9NEOP|nr:hypothetical protein ONE63_001663 [Megalurothrips usitatus]